MYYAAIEREREANDTRPVPDSPWNAMFKRFIGRSDKIVYPDDSDEIPSSLPEATEAQRTIEHHPNGKFDGINAVIVETPWYNVSDPERERAYRSLRVASWQACFYLITTDILGYSTAPEAFNELGIGPGILVYVFFYLLAVFAGQVIWRLYCSYDSSRYPVKCYADLGERIFGKAVRHIFNIFQSFQLLFNVALLMVGNGLTLVTMVQWKFCYIALNIFFMLIGMAGGQIRSLRNFASFASVSIFLNLMVIILTITGIWTYPPSPSQSYHADLSEPIVISGWIPSYTTGYQQISGVQLAVFAYGGAMIFPGECGTDASPSVKTNVVRSQSLWPRCGNLVTSGRRWPVPSWRVAPLEMTADMLIPEV